MSPDEAAAKALHDGSMTLCEFEEFQREYDRLLCLIKDTQELIGIQRIFIAKPKTNK